MEETKREMIESALAAGGEPPRGYRSLDQCFTVEHSLGVIILWYNVGQSTRVVVRNHNSVPTPAEVAG